MKKVDFIQIECYNNIMAIDFEIEKMQKYIVRKILFSHSSIKVSYDYENCNINSTYKNVYHKL